MNCAGVDCREIEDLPVDAEQTALRAATDAQASSMQ
jgi:hypothetical protein